MFIDIHAHLNLSNLPVSVDEAVFNARALGVEKFIVPSIDRESSKEAIKIAGKFQGICFASVGVHPWQIVKGEDSDSQIDAIKVLARDDRVFAIGETGIDYHHFDAHLTSKKQKSYFLRQLEIAKDNGKPVIVHGRKAYHDVIPIIGTMPTIKGVLHSFEASYEVAKEALDLGWFLSFTALITYSNYQWLREVMAKIPIDRMMIETDSPYLIPQAIKDQFKIKGRNNQPAYLIEIAKVVAEVKGISLEEVANVTYQNAKQLFSLVI